MLRENSIFLVRTKVFKLHLLCWSLFIAYEIIMVGLIAQHFEGLSFYAAFYTLNISLFYFFAHRILPYIFRPGAYWYLLLPVGVVGTFVPYYLITVFLDALLSGFSDLRNRLILSYAYFSILRSIYRYLLFAGFSSGYYALMTFLRERRRAEKTEREKLIAELEQQKAWNELVRSRNTLLKVEINPHILFNTLNFIFSNTRKSLPELADVIMVLSEVMHFSVNIRDSQTESPILLELQQVKNLIYLHQLRIAGNAFIALEYDDMNLQDVRIIPLIVITLVENMFKHGDLSYTDPPAKLMVTYNKGILQIITKNRQQNSVDYDSDAGLDKIKKRLELSYGERAQFKTYGKRRVVFTTTLTIHR